MSLRHVVSFRERSFISCKDLRVAGRKGNKCVRAAQLPFLILKIKAYGSTGCIYISVAFTFASSNVFLVSVSTASVLNP